ncbi:MAG: hypothetical protein PHQ75_11855 [Thermoguttaceae bacterium]|nr:hypothetical protein [Thermoguttaceae bacterium]
MLNDIFTTEEADAFLQKNKTGNVNTRKALLAYYKKTGRILSVRRGLYAVVPFGLAPDLFIPDPILIAAKATPDAVLAWHTALDFHARSYTNWNTFYFASNRASQAIRFSDCRINGIVLPSTFWTRTAKTLGVEVHTRGYTTVRVTSLERTFVDIMDRPLLGGSWEEIWRSLDNIEYFDLSIINKYLRLVSNSTTVARVAFYLERNQERLMVDKRFLKRLEKLVPSSPVYWDRNNRKGGHLIKRWNIIVPTFILNKEWETVL